MGRSVLILAIGATIILGIVQLGLTVHKETLVNNVADYSSDNHAKNTAFTTIQLAMEKINQDNTWHPTKSSPWNSKIEDADVSLYYETIGTGATSLDADTIRIYATSRFLGEEATIISTFQKQRLDFVPEFEAALSIATNKFNFTMSGSAGINGNDASGTCPDKPGITVPDLISESKVISGAGSKLGSIESNDTQVSVDPNVSYSPVDELIARLENLPGSVQISGNYKGTLGSADNPGIFFVNNYAKLSGGIPDGHGILVVRSGGELELEGALDLAGNVTFNGLVIFENAYDFNGKGTPTINGSVLVGNTPGSNDIIDIDISGNLQLQYDCSAQEYAKIASAELLKQNRYIRLNTFE